VNSSPDEGGAGCACVATSSATSFPARRHSRSSWNGFGGRSIRTAARRRPTSRKDSTSSKQARSRSRPIRATPAGIAARNEAQLAGQRRSVSRGSSAAARPRSPQGRAQEAVERRRLGLRELRESSEALPVLQPAQREGGC
jgi:hypothetical protein